MPKYVIFLIVPNRSEAKHDKEVVQKVAEDPDSRKMLHDIISWINAEVEAKRIVGGESILPASEDTNIRIDFHTRSTNTNDTKTGLRSALKHFIHPSTVARSEAGQKGDDPKLPSSAFTVTRPPQDGMSTNLVSYLTAEFTTVNEVIAWAQTCPIPDGGFSMEIRELKGTAAVFEEAPPEERDTAGDMILSMRKELLEEGKMKKEADGTQWVKLEDEDGIKQVVAEAEEREAKKVLG